MKMGENVHFIEAKHVQFDIELNIIEFCIMIATTYHEHDEPRRVCVCVCVLQLVLYVYIQQTKQFGPMT